MTAVKKKAPRYLAHAVIWWCVLQRRFQPTLTQAYTMSIYNWPGGEKIIGYVYEREGQKMIGSE